jgi:hypothetical protein
LSCCVVCCICPRFWSPNLEQRELFGWPLDCVQLEYLSHLISCIIFRALSEINYFISFFHFKKLKIWLTVPGQLYVQKIYNTVL